MLGPQTVKSSLQRVLMVFWHPKGSCWRRQQGEGEGVRLADFPHNLCGNLVHGHEKVVEPGQWDRVNKVCPFQSLERDERMSEAGEWLGLRTSPSLFCP